MRILREDILNYIKDMAHRPMKMREIFKAMRIPESDYGAFRRSIRELEREGELVRLRGGRYGSPENLNLVTGRLSITQSGSGFVTRETGGSDIFVDAINMGTALHRDRVVVRLHRSGARRKAPEGMVIRVLERALKSLVGTYRRHKSFGFVDPDDPKITRDIYIAPQDAKGAKEGQKVVAKIVNWESPHLNPEGKISEVLGYPEDPGLDILSIIKGHGLPIDFADDVLEDAEKIPLKIPPEEIERRTDLRDIVCFTIDPEDARDFDDAVSLEIKENGNFLLGVHIADVSYYVKEKSTLDQEALARGTSVYLVDRVIPMLPENLSNDVCSLRPDEDRLTMSVLLELDGAGDVQDYQIVESVIKSRVRLTYQQAQAVIIGDDDNAGSKALGLKEHLCAMQSLSKILIAKREGRGSIDFDLPEAKVILDEDGKPLDIRKVERLDSHRLIEEFMLLANSVVAEHAESLNLPFMYRVHDSPDETKLEDFATFMKSLGYNFKLKDKITPGYVQGFLKRVEGKKGANLIFKLLLRSMKLALYSHVNIGHFGLAYRSYSHFTSPIRRYPDLMIHRILKDCQTGKLGDERREELVEHLPSISHIASQREQDATEAERDSIKIKQIEFMEERLGEEYWGVVSDVKPYGLFVELEDFMVEGLIHVRILEDDYYNFDDRTYMLVGRHTGKKYRLGDRLRVQVVRADRRSKQIDFMPAEG